MIYLYVKTHNKTGLKYLGKTVAQDPHLYKGSGKRWRAHCQKHGYDYSTEILFQSNCKNEIKEKGLYYSRLWNIVESKEWANLMPEQCDGGDTSMSDTYKAGIKTRDTSGSKNSMYGRSAIVENNIKWYNNGIKNLYIPEGTQPAEYIPGRIINYKKPHSEQTKQKLAMYGNKPCISPTGQIYTSRKEAATAHGITPEAIGGLIKRGVSGWKWL
jgi:hypothetical protein